MEEKLRAYPKLCKEIGMEEISVSQLCRRINDLPTEWIQKLFVRVVAIMNQLTDDKKGLPGGIGRLNIVVFY